MSTDAQSYVPATVPAVPQGPLPQPWPPPANCNCVTWAGVLGTFLLAFGFLDYLVTLFLKLNLPELEFVKLRGRGFKDRLDRMALVLKEVRTGVEDVDWFAGLVRRLDAVRAVRNHVAHAHLYSQPDPVTGQFVVTLFTAKDADTGLLAESKHVTFKELATANNDLQDVIVHFQALAGFTGEYEIELP